MTKLTADKVIQFDRPTVARLRRAYDAAVKDGAEAFIFEDRDLLTAYAKYLLEYLDTRFAAAEGKRHGS